MSGEVVLGHLTPPAEFVHRTYQHLRFFIPQVAGLKTMESFTTWCLTQRQTWNIPSRPHRTRLSGGTMVSCPSGSQRKDRYHQKLGRLLIPTHRRWGLEAVWPQASDLTSLNICSPKGVRGITMRCLFNRFGVRVKWIMHIMHISVSFSHYLWPSL